MARGFQYNPPSVAPPGTYPFSENLQVNAGDGELQRIVLAGDVTLLPPINGTDGGLLECWLMNATTGSVNLNFDDAIGVGQNGESQPIVIDENTTADVKMRYDGPRNLWSLDGLMDQF